MNWFTFVLANVKFNLEEIFFLMKKIFLLVEITEISIYMYISLFITSSFVFILETLRV